MRRAGEAGPEDFARTQQALREAAAQFGASSRGQEGCEVLVLLHWSQARGRASSGDPSWQGGCKPPWSCPMDAWRQSSSEQLLEELTAISPSSHPVTRQNPLPWLRPSSAQWGCWAPDLQPFPPPFLPSLSGHSQAVSQQTLLSRRHPVGGGELSVTQPQPPSDPLPSPCPRLGPLSVVQLQVAFSSKP